jgi:hypothetical protein
LVDSTCTCNDEICKAARRKKTLNQIAKKAVFEALRNTKGAYAGRITLELRGRR